MVSTQVPISKFAIQLRLVCKLSGMWRFFRQRLHPITLNTFVIHPKRSCIVRLVPLENSMYCGIEIKYESPLGCQRSKCILKRGLRACIHTSPPLEKEALPTSLIWTCSLINRPRNRASPPAVKFPHVKPVSADRS